VLGRPSIDSWFGLCRKEHVPFNAQMHRCTPGEYPARGSKSAVQHKTGSASFAATLGTCNRLKDFRHPCPFCTSQTKMGRPNRFFRHLPCPLSTYLPYTREWSGSTKSVLWIFRFLRKIGPTSHYTKKDTMTRTNPPANATLPTHSR
jgi:hypothetical protein